MDKLSKVIQNLKNISLSEVLFEANNNPQAIDEIEFVIRARLDTSGTTASGVKLRTDTAITQGEQAYAIRTVTVFMKSPTSYVNLNDEGDFHDSIEAIPTSSGDINIIGEFNKRDGNIYDNFQIQFGTQKEFENDILNLNEKEIYEYAKVFVLPEVKKAILKACNV